jgi:hypothetical protein
MTFAERDSQRTNDAVYHAVFLSAVPDRPPTGDVLARHAAHLAELDHQGLLALAGPFLDRTGGLFVLRTLTTTEAARIAAEDPMVRGGFQSYRVVAWAQADTSNDYQPDLGRDAGR